MDYVPEFDAFGAESRQEKGKEYAYDEDDDGLVGIDEENQSNGSQEVCVSKKEVAYYIKDFVQNIQRENSF